VKEFSTRVKNFPSITMCMCPARAWTGVPNHSWQLPGTLQPAFWQTQALTRHLGNTSRQTRQRNPADRQTLIWHSGNTFGTLSATLTQHHGNAPGAQSATATLTRHSGKTSRHILRTITQNGTHFPRVPGMAPAVFFTQHGNNTYYTTKKGLKWE